MLCLTKVNSNTIKSTVHTSCCCISVLIGQQDSLYRHSGDLTKVSPYLYKLAPRLKIFVVFENHLV